MKKQTVPPQAYRYYMVNKPTGCVCACRDAENSTVMELFPEELREGLFPVGRLDKYTEGLLLVTDDGKLCRHLLAPECHVAKRYRLWALGNLTEEGLQRLADGICVKGLNEPLRMESFRVLYRGTAADIDAPLFPKRRGQAEEQPESPAFLAEIVLTEGKRHQIKRMLEAVGCAVAALKRTRFGALQLDEALAPGRFRPLTKEEVQQLQRR